jgi:PAS domain S-box-containing protein
MAKVPSIQTNQNSKGSDRYSDPIFQNLADLAASAIFLFQDSQLKYANPAAEVLTGYSKSDLLGMKVHKLFPEDGKNLLLDRKNAIPGDDPQITHGEIKMITKAGEDRWIDLTASIIEFHSAPALICTAIDISEHKRGEVLQDAVYRIALAADRSNGLDDLFSAVHAIIAEVMNADNFYIALYDDQNDLISFPYFIDQVDMPPKPNKLGRGLTEYVLRTGKSQLVDLALHDELCNLQEIELVGVPSPIWLGVPLIVDSEVIGVMVVQHYSDPNIYSVREKRILEFVSSQVAMAINRKRFEDAMKESEERYHRRADELEALYETGRDLATLQDLNVLLSTVADRVINLLKSHGCTIYLYDDERKELNVVVARGLPGMVGMRMKLGEDIAGKVAQSCRSMIVEDLRKWSDRSSRFEDMKVTAIAGVPMLFSNKLIGVLSVYEIDKGDHLTLREYSPADVDLLSVFADTAAVAVNNARLFDETQKRLLEIQVLYQTSLAAIQINSVRAIAQHIVGTLEQLLNWQNNSIWLIDNTTQKPKQIAHNKLDLSEKESYLESSPLIDSNVEASTRIVELVCSSGQPILTGDIRSLSGNNAENIETLSVLCVPLKIGGKTIGCINVESSKSHSFEAHDRQILSTLAAQAASAIDNANLYQEAILSASRRSVLHQASQEIAQSSQDPEEVYSAVHRAAAQLMPADVFVITLYDDTNQVIHGVYLIARGVRHPDIEFQVGQGISSKVIISGKSLLIHDFQNSPQDIAPYLFSNEGMTRSILAVPMRAGERITGMISVQSYEPNTFTSDDGVLLEMLAAHAGAAIENARLFEETRRRSIHQAVLNSIITVTAHGGADPAEILNTTLEQTLKALDLELGSLWLSWSTRGVQRMASKNIPSSINSAMANSTILAGYSQTQTLVVDDWRNSTNKYSHLFVSSDILSTIIVPLISKENTVGGMAIASKDMHHWTTEEITLVEAIGREVGSAAERAKLFEETTVRLDELEAVNKVSKSLRLAQSLQDMLPLLMDETLNILDVNSGAIWLFNSDHDKLIQVIGRGWCTKLADLELDRDESLPGKVFSTGDIYFSHDVAQDSLTSPAMRSLVPEECSAICLPIHSEHEPIGILFASTKLPREFTIENAHLLVTLTEIAGNAIHRTRLNEQMVQHAAELEIRVTERTAELQSALKKAQAADQLKSEFIINVNHELRTPLTNLVLYYQMLKAQPNIKSAERLEVIGRELQRLRTLIEELLNLSRFDLGQVRPRFIPCDLNALIQTLMDDRRSLAEERGLTLNTNLQASLESVWMDEPTITQAVSNLLTNAMNYTPRGGKILAETMTKLLGEERWVGFRVQDTGRGIEDNDMPHLFERFFRGKAGHDSGAPGTGLGLAIVKQVVEIHRGQIDVEKGESGSGAMFTIWLPGKQPQETS